MQINEIDVNEIRHETVDNREWLVAPVTAMKATYLDGGYVPAEHVKKSERAWNGEPITLNHPTAPNGEFVSANSPEIAEKTVLGRFYNVKYDEETTELNGEIWIDVTKAEQLGGQASEAVEMLENEEAVSVSTAYFGDELPPGVYDGKHRHAVIGNIRPDHLAVLPDGEGRCSIDDGCMAGVPAVNMLVTNTGVKSDILENARTPTYNGVEDISWDDEAEQLSYYQKNLDIEDVDWPELSEEDRVKVAEHTLLGDPQAEIADHGIAYPVVNAETGKLNKEALESVTGDGEETARKLLENEFKTNMTDLEQEGEEFGKGFMNTLRNTLGIDMTTRDEMITVLVNEHGFKEDSLEGMGDECLKNTFESFNDDVSEEQETEVEETEESEVEETEEDPVISKLEQIESEMVTVETVEEMIAANQEQDERQELVAEIVKNSEDYPEEELQDTPISVLKNIREDVKPDTSANFMAQRGAAANSVDEAEDFPTLSVNGEE